MNDLVTCPQCGGAIPLSLAMQARLADEARRIRQQVEDESKARFDDESSRIRAQAEEAARDRFTREASEASRAKDEELAELRKKALEASTREAELLRRKRELEDKERQLGVELEKRLTAEAVRIRAEAELEAKGRLELQLKQAAMGQEEAQRKAQEALDREREAQRLREAEHQQQADALQRQVADLQRKLVMGSQQAQGEVQEVVLKEMLSQAFLADRIGDVPKGQPGADLLQVVRGADGGECGSILWESKRTKNWYPEWIPKLKDDQREAGVACSVLVSQVLPEGVRHFAQRDGVWVCDFGHAVPLAAALRAALIDVAKARRIAENRGENAQMLYDYLTGPDFQNRVNGVVEAFDDLRKDLHKEQLAMARIWKKREGQLHRAAQNLAAMFGAVQGLAGKTLTDIAALGLPSTEEGDEDGEATTEVHT